jgi:hypothetical protein
MLQSTLEASARDAKVRAAGPEARNIGGAGGGEAVGAAAMMMSGLAVFCHCSVAGNCTVPGPRAPPSPPNHRSLSLLACHWSPQIEQLLAIMVGGGTPTEYLRTQAQFFLEAANWDVEVAVANAFNSY